MKMQKRKYAVLAGAALAALPIVSSAAINVTYSYDSSTLFYATSLAGLATGTPVTISGGAVNIPANDFFEFGVDVTVTGNVNPGNAAYDSNVGGHQPANLGVSGFGFNFNDSTPSVLTPFQNATGVTRVTIASIFSTTGAGDVNTTTGSIGADGAYLSGGNNTNVTDPGPNNTNTPLLTVGVGGSQIFTHLVFKAVAASGSTTITPFLAPGGTAIVVEKTAGSASSAPGYGSTTAGFTTTNLPALTINVGSTGGGGGTTGTNKIISLTANPSTGTAPNGYGTVSLGTLSPVNGSPVGINFSSGGVAVGYVTDTVGSPVYALKVAIGGTTLAPSDSRLSAIVADINASDNGIVTAKLMTSSTHYGSLFPGYDILITTATSGSDPAFQFDFSSTPSDGTDSDTALGAVTVTSIAAVPEPATAAGVILGAAGLLLGRRKNRLQAVV